MAAPLMKGLLNLLASKNSLEVAKSALPGAAVNAVVGVIAAGPAGALGYGLGYFLLNYPLMRAARKISPATAELVTNLIPRCPEVIPVATIVLFLIIFLTFVDSK